MRIKITEHQFNRILLEDSSEGIFYDLNDGDNIAFVSGGDNLSFKVIDQTDNAIWMTSNDKGSVHTSFTYLLAKSEKLDDNNITLFRYQPSKGESQEDKKQFTFNTVTKVDVYDYRGKLKDSYTVGGEEDDGEDNVGYNLVDVLAEFSSMKVDDRYFFELDNGTNVLFKVLDKSNAEAKLKLVSVNGSDKATYEPLKGQTFTLRFDADSLAASESTPKGIDVVFTDESGNPLKLSDIKDWGDYYSTIQDVNPDSDTGELSDTMSKDEILNTIMSNPVLRDTFYKQPKLMGFINSGEPVGIATANQILAKFKSQSTNGEEDKSTNNANFKNFKNGKKVSFRLMSDVMFSFGNGADSIKLEAGNSYQGKVFKDEKNTYLKSDEGSKKWSIMLKSSVGNHKYDANIKAYVKGKYGKLDEQNKNIQIRVTNYNG